MARKQIAESSCTVTEAAHYGREVAKLKKDPIVKAMAKELPKNFKMTYRNSNEPTGDFTMMAMLEYSRRGGKNSQSIGGVARAIVALRKK